MNDRFNLDVAIATWRRFLLSDHAITKDDADELETHLRDLVDDMTAEGMDLEEAFRRAGRQMGSGETLGSEYRRSYWKKVRSDRRIRDEIRWRTTMLGSYIKLTLRNLRREKGFAFINIFGLSLGIAAAILLLLIVRFETTWDGFHEHVDRIYEVGEPAIKSNSTWEFYITRTPALPLMIEEIPEIVGGSRMFAQSHWISVGDYRKKRCCTS